MASTTYNLSGGRGGTELNQQGSPGFQVNSSATLLGQLLNQVPPSLYMTMVRALVGANAMPGAMVGSVSGMKDPGAKALLENLPRENSLADYNPPQAYNVGPAYGNDPNPQTFSSYDPYRPWLGTDQDPNVIPENFETRDTIERRRLKAIQNAEEQRQMNLKEQQARINLTNSGIGNPNFVRKQQQNDLQTQSEQLALLRQQLAVSQQQNSPEFQRRGLLLSLLGLLR